MRIGAPRLTLSAGVFAAKDLGFFEREGVDVELVEFALGKEALVEMFAGRLDFALAAETPLVHSAAEGEKYLILATVARSSTAMALVGRRDRGMHSFRDVRGRRIGVTKGTNAEFFFDSFRVLNAIPREQLVLVEVSPERLVEALEEGRVDAVCAWEPHLSELRDRFGERAFYFDGGGIYKWTWNLATTREVLNKRSKAVEQVLRALWRAGESFEKDGAPAGQALERRGLGAADGAAGKVAQALDYRPHLSQQLVLQMEAQHRWVAAGGGTIGTNAPNFLHYIDASPLARVAPEAVSLVD